jgi:hypothetical protein
MAVHEKLKKKWQQLWQSNLTIIFVFVALQSFAESCKAL